MKPGPESEPIVDFFCVPTSKLIVMSVCTLNLYIIYWQYRQWKAIRSRSRFEDLSPILRAWFNVIFSFSLFERIRTASRGHISRRVPWSPVILGLGYLVLASAHTLPRFGAPQWLLLFGYTRVFVLVPVQRTINEMVPDPTAGFGVRSDYSAMELMFACIGSVFLILVVMGVFVAKKHHA